MHWQILDFSLKIFQAADIDSESKLHNLEDLMYSIRCQVCPEGFPVIVGPGSTVDELRPHICKNCQNEPSKEVLINYLEVKENVEKVLTANPIELGEPKNCVT